MWKKNVLNCGVTKVAGYLCYDSLIFIKFHLPVKGSFLLTWPFQNLNIIWKHCDYVQYNSKEMAYAVILGVIGYKISDLGSVGVYP